MSINEKVTVEQMEGWKLYTLSITIYVDGKIHLIQKTVRTTNAQKKIPKKVLNSVRESMLNTVKFALANTIKIFEGGLT